MPIELQQALVVDGLCKRYGQPRSVILAEDVAQLKMLAIITEGQPAE